MTTMTHHGLFTHAQVNCVTDNVTLTTYVHGVTITDAFNDGKKNCNDHNMQKISSYKYLIFDVSMY